MKISKEILTNGIDAVKAIVIKEEPAPKKKCCGKACKILAIVAIVAAVAGIAFAVCKLVKPSYVDEFEEEEKEEAVEE